MQAKTVSNLSFHNFQIFFSCKQIHKKIILLICKLTASFQPLQVIHVTSQVVLSRSSLLHYNHGRSSKKRHRLCYLEVHCYTTTMAGHPSDGTGCAVWELTASTAAGYTCDGNYYLHWASLKVLSQVFFNWTLIYFIKPNLSHTLRPYLSVLFLPDAILEIVTKVCAILYKKLPI